MYLFCGNKNRLRKRVDNGYWFDMKTSKCFDRASCSWDCKPRITGLIHDPVEESEAYLSIEKELEEKLRSYFSDKRFDSGSWFRTPVSCFEYWQVMKRFLWEDYRIEWRSPVELNPTIFKDDL